MKPDAPAPRLWPRWAVSPTGSRARFDCVGDIPHGWKLEIPLPGSEPVEVATEPPKRRGRPPKSEAA